uniref:Uncharacterized protein n=1 Tax=Cacopsylla melanoneura TaxID=428564 RepID=A0A8D8ZSZ2_9HEMI
MSPNRIQNCIQNPLRAPQANFSKVRSVKCPEKRNQCRNFLWTDLFYIQHLFLFITKPPKSGIYLLLWSKGQSCKHISITFVLLESLFHAFPPLLCEYMGDANFSGSGHHLKFKPSLTKGRAYMHNIQVLCFLHSARRCIQKMILNFN